MLFAALKHLIVHRTLVALENPINTTARGLRKICEKV
jgi:hypothetical protein